jgi:hypothetical protein
MGFNYYREVYLGLNRPKSNYRGYLDFVIEAEVNKYTIEIDSSNKKWSLQKLIHSNEKGFIPI